jgi:hypothetical protein
MDLADSVARAQQWHSRSSDLRLCLALGTSEPGHGAEGQDEEEANQKTPPARTSSATISKTRIALEVIANIPVSHVDVEYMDKEMVVPQLFAVAVPKGSASSHRSLGGCLFHQSSQLSSNEHRNFVS